MVAGRSNHISFKDKASAGETLSLTHGSASALATEASAESNMAVASYFHVQ